MHSFFKDKDVNQVQISVTLIKTDPDPQLFRQGLFAFEKIPFGALQYLQNSSYLSFEQQLYSDQVNDL